MSLNALPMPEPAIAWPDEEPRLTSTWNPRTTRNCGGKSLQALGVPTHPVALAPDCPLEATAE
eukprot:593913-Heterocapsa_arctica.AAC.1